MNSFQQHQLWIGFGFATILVTFLIIAFFIKERLSDDQRNILRFLCALCAGFSGALITGEALFNLNTSLGGSTKIAVSGSAGAALFFTIWFTFKTLAPPPDAYHFSIPSGWKFEMAVKAMVNQDDAIAELIDFNDSEKNAVLKPQTIRTSTIIKALESLRSSADGAAIRPYDIYRDEHVIRIKVKK